jgi:hypothetical protein
MNYINIICYDKIGLTIDNQFHEINFFIENKINFNFDKIKKICINKINEIYNPKYPYFFCNTKKLSNIIQCKTKYSQNTLFVELYALNNIYKLKFLELSDFPIHYICSGKDLSRHILETLTSRYPICNSCILKFNNVKLNINVPIEFYDLHTNKINELIIKKSDMVYINSSSK